MKRNILRVVICLLALLASAASAGAQVKRVQMHIAGYLCGN